MGLFSFGRKNNSSSQLCAPVNGTMIPLTEVPDPTFSTGVLGNGAAFEPLSDDIVAPCDGVIENVFETCHAVSMTSDSGAEILIHIGLETVELQGKHYQAFVKDGQKVKKGDKLISFDRKAAEEAGYKTVTPMVICNSDEFEVSEFNFGDVKVGSPAFSVKKN